MPATRPRARTPFAGTHPRFRRLIIALVLIAGAAIGSGVSRPAFAQIAAPGPVLGGGDLINPQVNLLTGVWEAFPAGNALGHVLYMWQGDIYVSRGFPCPSTSLSTPCYNWIQYFYDSDDPYNTDLWSPFQRGCMLLGANPLVAAEADGLSRVTDTYVAGDVFTPISNDVEPVGLLNDEGSGKAGITSVSALDSACSGGPIGPTSGGGTTSWAGTWSTTYGTMQLNQSGSSVTGTYEANGGRLTGTVSGSLLRGTWAEMPSYAPPDHAGDFEFELGPQGNSFIGRWRYGTSGAYSFTEWIGTRTGGATPGTSQPGTSQPVTRSWTGTWSTTMHTMRLSQSGSSVTGTFDCCYGGRLTGTVSGNVLRGTWSDGDGPTINHGDFEFTLSADGNSFAGHGRYFNSGMLWDWSGYRIP
jgi:hypothetical protein